MKKRILLFCMAASLAACHNHRHIDNVPGTAIDTANTGRQITLLNERLHALDVPSQIFTAPPDRLSIVKGNNGTVVYVVPEDLELDNGGRPEQPIIVELKELNSREDMLRAGAQTMSDRRLLVSGGSYYLNMTSGGKALHIKSDRMMKVAFPRSTDSSMRLFYGQRNEKGQMNWLPAQRLTSGHSFSIDATDDTSIMVYDERNYNLLGYVGNDSTYKRDTTKLNALRRKLKARMIADLQRSDSISRIKYTLSKRLNSTMYDVAEIKKLGWINCD